MKKLSKKDRIILAVAGVALAIALCCQGWYYWPWFGGTENNKSSYSWGEFPSYITSPIATPPTLITNHTQYSNRQVIKYFNDIVLHREYDSSVHTCVKWVSPIRLCVIDPPSSQELDIINKICAFLNNIPGFPGITQTTDPFESDITLTFFDDTHFSKGVYAWFNIITQDEHENLKKVDIRVRSTLNSDLMSSVLWEEILQSTGPMNDTSLTDNTLFTSLSIELTQPSELDRTILEMLYHPAIKSGMDYLHCLSVFALFFD